MEAFREEMENGSVQSENREWNPASNTESLTVYVNGIWKRLEWNQKMVNGIRENGIQEQETVFRNQ